MAAPKSKTPIKDQGVARASFRKLDADEEPQTSLQNFRCFEEGEYLFKYGDEGGDLYFIKEGEVEVFRPQDGHEYHFCTMVAGEVLGVASMLDKKKRAASARALTAVKVQVVGHGQFTKMIGDSPKWLNALVRDLGNRLEHSNLVYIKSAAKLQQLEESRGTILRVSAHVAKSMILLARLETTLIEKRKVSPLDSVQKKIVYIGSYTEKFIESLVEIFRQSQLIIGESINGMFFLTAQDIINLQFYEHAALAIDGEKTKSRDFFSVKELGELRQWSNHWQAKVGYKSELRLEIYDLQTGVVLAEELYNKALRRNLIQKAGDSVKLEFSELSLNINCLEAMLRIKKQLNQYI